MVIDISRAEEQYYDSPAKVYIRLEASRAPPTMSADQKGEPAETEAPTPPGPVTSRAVSFTGIVDDGKEEMEEQQQENGQQHQQQQQGGDYTEVISGFGEARKVFVKEVKKLCVIAAPITFNMVCLYGISSFTIMFAGHLGNLQLSAAATALSVISNLSFGFMLGMGCALETLCGQAFGAGRLQMLGIYLQRSWLILFSSSLLLTPTYVFATPILKLFGQSDEIAEAAGRFALDLLPSLFALAINFPAQKFLQAQSKVGVLAWVGFLGLPLHLLLLWLFIYVLGWGLRGAALAFDITLWAVSLGNVAYIVGWCRNTWTGLSVEAFREIWAFARLSFASAVMLCLEIWYNMILVVLAGDLKEDAQLAVGSISICMNVNGWASMVFVGINAAISVRVSNELGRGRPRATKYSVVSAVLLTMVIGVAWMTAVVLSRNSFAVIFTSDKEMQRAVAKIAYLLGLTLLLSSVQLAVSGIAVGGGWQALVAYINLGCYYIFGLPLGFLLGHVFHLGVEGIWIGMLCGTSAQTLVLLIVVWRTNWKKEAAKASARVQRWGGQVEPESNTSTA